MAVVNYRVDDLDKSTPVTRETTILTLNGRKVAIDLSDDNFAKLEKALAKYFENGIVSESRTGNAKAATADSQDRNAEIRSWALANGFNIAERGRLAKNVVDAYEEWERAQESATPAAESSAA